jgi:hypothetical protein
MKSKVICVGLPRTGTTSLGVSMRYLGYNHLSYKKENNTLFKNGEISSLMEIVSNYDSFDDSPWPYLFKQIDNLYPDSKYILTIRKTPDIWFKSICNLADILGPQHSYPYNEKDKEIARYLKHNGDVQKYFKHAPNKLITLCWENGDGWKEICSFLNHPIPDIPFPYAHKTPSSLLKLPKPIKWIIRHPRYGPIIRKIRWFVKNLFLSKK